MKTNFIIIIISLIVIGGLIVFHHFETSRLQKEYALNLEYKNGEVQEVISKYTNEISFQNKIFQSERKMSEQLFAKELESISRELSINKKNIKEMINLNYKIQNSGSTNTVVIRDTINNTPDKYQFSWSDSFLVVSGTSSFDSTYLDYSYSDSIRMAGFIKKNGLLGLGKKDYLIDVRLGNQKAKVTHLQKVEFDKPVQSKYSLGVGVGYYYIPQLNKPYFGVGITIQRNVLNF